MHTFDSATGEIGARADAQAGMHADKQAGAQADAQTDTHAGAQADPQSCAPAGAQADTQADGKNRALAGAQAGPDTGLSGRNAQSDHIVRGTAAAGMVRALAIDATDTVREAQRRHGATPVATEALGRLLMASQMMGALFKEPGEKLTLMVRCDGPLGGLTVTADTSGHVKGYAVNPQASASEASDAIGSGTLVVVRDTPHVEPYVSQIALVNGTISDDLMAYYILSEQIPTLIGLEVLFDPRGLVSRAGGYFIQLMPGYEEATLAALEAAVSAAEPLADLLARGISPTELLEHLLGPLGYTGHERLDAAWKCDCSRERSERTLLSLGAAELSAMVDEREPVTITCDFCGEAYTFTADDLKNLSKSLE